MSVYFIHAEARLSSGVVVDKISNLIVASDAISASEKFITDEDVQQFARQGISVVVDKFEKVE